VRYQGVSGDFNAAHHDDQAARRFGVPTAFSLGMLHAGYLGTVATDWLGAENVRGVRVRFVEMVFPGDLLACTVSIKAIEAASDGEVVELELTARNQNDTLVAEGSARFHLPRQVSQRDFRT